MKKEASKSVTDALNLNNEQGIGSGFAMIKLLNTLCFKRLTLQRNKSTKKTGNVITSWDILSVLHNIVLTFYSDTVFGMPCTLIFSYSSL